MPFLKDYHNRITASSYEISNKSVLRYDMKEVHKNRKSTNCAITSLPLVIGKIALCWIADGLSKPSNIQNKFYYATDFTSCQFVLF